MSHPRNRIALVSLSTPEIATLQQVTSPSKAAYCQRWGHDFIEEHALIDPTRPPSWSKLLLIKKHLAKYDWMMWIDTDARIMNPELDIETLLDDTHDFILAKGLQLDPFGVHNINLGVFFIRNCPWSHAFLDRIYAQEQFIHHLCWEQAAFCHLYETEAEVRPHVRVDLDNRRFNSFASDYRKGDLIFHAVEPRRLSGAKVTMLEQAAAEDAQIDFPFEPEVQILALPSPETASLLAETLLATLLNDPYRHQTSPVTVGNLRDSGFSAMAGFAPVHQWWFDKVHTFLDLHPGALILIAHQPIQFSGRWERALLVNLGAADLLFSATHGSPDGRLLFLRNTTAMRLWLGDLEQAFTQLPAIRRSHPDALRELLAGRLPSSTTQPEIHALPLDPRYFSDALETTGFNILNLAIEMPATAWSVQETRRRFQDSRHIRQAFMARMNSYLATPATPESPR